MELTELIYFIRNRVGHASRIDQSINIQFRIGTGLISDCLFNVQSIADINTKITQSLRTLHSLLNHTKSNFYKFLLKLNFHTFFLN